MGDRLQDTSHITVTVPTSDVWHTLVVAIELDPESVDRDELHARIRAEVDQALDDRATAAQRAAWHRTLAATAELFGLTVEDILSRANDRPTAVARSVVYLVACDRFGLSHAEVGRLTGRDRSSVTVGVHRAARTGAALRAAGEVERAVLARLSDDLRDRLELPLTEVAS